MPAVKPLRREDVAALHALRHRFGRPVSRRKARLLDACARRLIADRAVAVAYHETLLFIAAHPDDAALRAAAEVELRRVAAALPELVRRRGAARSLQNSGLPGSVMDTRYSYDLSRWLAERHGRHVEITWREGEVGETINDVFDRLALPAERDGLLTSKLTIDKWARLAAGPRRSALQWVLQRLAERVGDDAVEDQIFEYSGIGVRWRLDDPAITRTLLRFPPRRLHYQRTAPRRVTAMQIIARPCAVPRPCPASEARRLIDVARATLAVRERETDPVTYADHREVLLFRLDGGVDVAIFGMRPDKRLPLESYFGYVAARNRVPVAYGGAWIFGHRAEIGIHLFESFRGGASDRLFAEVMRAYGHGFGVQRFLVDPYQFGADNNEAIRTGAYWFYDRLGFRPQDPEVAALADRERQRLARAPGARTPPRTLRRFARGPVALDVAPAAAAPPSVAAIGLAVTHHLRDRFGGDRRRAVAWARRRVARLVPPIPRRRDDEAARRRYDDLAPLVALLPGVESWTARERRDLGRLMLAKGGPREGDYVRAVQRHPRFLDALGELAAQGGRPAGR